LSTLRIPWCSLRLKRFFQQPQLKVGLPALRDEKGGYIK